MVPENKKPGSEGTVMLTIKVFLIAAGVVVLLLLLDNGVSAP